MNKVRPGLRAYLFRKNGITATLERIVHLMSTRALNIKLSTAREHLDNQQQLARLNNVIAGLAHELNTPLGTVLTAATIIDEKTNQLNEAIAQGKTSRLFLEKTNNSYKLCIDNIMQSTGTAIELIRQLKGIKADDYINEVKQLNIKEIIDSAAAKFVQLNSRLKVKVIAEPGSRCLYKGIPVILEKIIESLIENSLDHAYAEAEEAPVCFKISFEQNYLKIIYTDYGCGFSKDATEQWLEPFWTTKRGVDKVGLGGFLIGRLSYWELRHQCPQW